MTDKKQVSIALTSGQRNAHQGSTKHILYLSKFILFSSSSCFVFVLMTTIRERVEFELKSVDDLKNH